MNREAYSWSIKPCRPSRPGCRSPCDRRRASRCKRWPHGDDSDQHLLQINAFYI